MLINRGMEQIGYRTSIRDYGWSLCFAHEDRQKMMSEFLIKAKSEIQPFPFLSNQDFVITLAAPLGLQTWAVL